MALRILCGLRNGQIPSITMSRANATPRSCHINPSTKKPGQESRLKQHPRTGDMGRSWETTYIILPEMKKLVHATRALLWQIGLLTNKLLTFLAFEIAKELGVGLQQHYVLPAGKDTPVRLQATVEGIEFIILLERLGIDLRRVGIAFTTQFL